MFVGLVELLQNLTEPDFFHYSCICSLCVIGGLSGERRAFQRRQQGSALAPMHRP